jgi:type I restriction enzyme S subunit
MPAQGNALGNMSQNTSSPEGAAQGDRIPIGDIVEPRVEQTGPQTSEFTYVDIGSIDRETKCIVDPKVLPLSKAPSRAKQLLRFGDVLVSMTRPNLNAVALVPEDLDGAVGSTGFHVLRARDAEPGYLFYAVQTPEFIDAMCLKVQGALYPAVRPRDISSFTIPLPPLSEQRRIVAEIEKQFTRLDAGVAALKRVQANLKRYRAAVLKAACEGKLVPTEGELQRSSREGGSGVPPLSRKKSQSRDGSATLPASYESGADLLARILEERRNAWNQKVAAASRRSSGNQRRDASATAKYKEPAAPDTSKLPELPEGWAWATLDALAEIKGGITKDQNRKHNAPTRSVPYLRVGNVQRGYIDLKEVKEIVATEDEIRELALKPGDILFNEGGDRDKLGRGWVWNGELPECIHQNHVFRARLYVAALNPKLVSWYANTFGQKFFFDEGKHTTNLASISMSKLKGLPVPIPPPAEQARIVAEVEQRLSVVEELESVVSANLQRATRLRQSILQKAFTGELHE